MPVQTESETSRVSLYCTLELSITLKDSYFLAGKSDIRFHRRKNFENSADENYGHIRNELLAILMDDDKLHTWKKH